MSPESNRTNYPPQFTQRNNVANPVTVARLIQSIPEERFALVWDVVAFTLVWDVSVITLVWDVSVFAQVWDI